MTLDLVTGRCPESRTIAVNWINRSTAAAPSVKLADGQ